MNAPGAPETTTNAECDDSAADIPWDFDIQYNKIKHAPWKADVYERLVKVRQDIRYAIDAKGWDAAEEPVTVPQGRHVRQALVLRVQPGQAQPGDMGLLEVLRGVAESVTGAAQCLTRQKIADWRPAAPGANLMSAYISLHAAEAGAVPLLDANRLKAKLPTVYEQAVAYLPKGDKRITTVTDLMGPGVTLAPSVDGWTAREVLTAANKIEDQQQLQVRAFRTTLGLTFLGALAVAIGLGFAAHFNPGFFPFCVKTGTTMACPSGGTTPSGSDVPLVMGVGALGAILSFVISLSSINPPSVRYSLSGVQGLLKIAFGALTAVIGIMALTTVSSSSSTVLNSQLKLLVAAAVFGYSQQLFTSVLDRKGTSLQNAAAGK